MSNPDEWVGHVLAGKYEIVGHMFAGRFGDFWSGKNLEDDSEVAVKLLRSENFEDEEALKRFERETDLLRNWKHPGLLRVLDSGVDNGAPWLVTVLKRGRPLYHEIANQEASVKVVCHMAAQIARVLAGAHARGIVHRGLNPDSVMLCQERGDPYRVKVLDFGVAKIPVAISEDEEQLTRVGQKLGSAEYMAPEYIEDNRLDARSDLYALGILIFEMLVGQPPFVGQSRRVMIKHMTEPAFPPSDLSMHEIPPWLDELVLKLLEKDPGDRPESAMIVADIFKQHR